MTPARRALRYEHEALIEAVYSCVQTLRHEAKDGPLVRYPPAALRYVVSAQMTYEAFLDAAQRRAMVIGLAESCRQTGLRGCVELPGSRQFASMWHRVSDPHSGFSLLCSFERDGVLMQVGLCDIAVAEAV